MHSKDDLVNDVGSVLIGKEAVECGLINEVGGLPLVFFFLATHLTSFIILI